MGIGPCRKSPQTLGSSSYGEDAPAREEGEAPWQYFKRLRRIGYISPLLMLFDRSIGHQNVFLTPQAPAKEEEDKQAIIDLSAINQIEESVLSQAKYTIKDLLRRAACRIHDYDLQRVHVQLFDEEKKNWRPFTKREAFLTVQALESALSASTQDDLENWAETLLNVAQTSYDNAAALLSTYYKGLDKAREFKVQFCSQYDREAYGMSATDLGLITALTGFMNSAHEGVITIPYFKQWDSKSEFVEFKMKDIPEKSRSIPRMWRYMYWQCVRAPCHEIIHSCQHICGQKMTTQVAEHDAYYSCNVLTLAVCGLPTCTFAYPGLGAEIVLASYQNSKRKLDKLPEGFDLKVYEKWRDSFGVAKGCWNDKNFGSKGDLSKSFEFIAGPLVTLEACAPDGKLILAPMKLQEQVKAMANTMFKKRDAKSHPGASEDAKQKRKILDCNSLEVEIAPRLSLSSLAIKARMDQLGGKIGKAKAIALKSELRS